MFWGQSGWTEGVEIGGTCWGSDHTVQAVQASKDVEGVGG